jgi:hypothetical protein
LIHDVRVVAFWFGKNVWDRGSGLVRGVFGAAGLIDGLPCCPCLIWCRLVVAGRYLVVSDTCKEVRSQRVVEALLVVRLSSDGLIRGCLLPTHFPMLCWLACWEGLFVALFPRRLRRHNCCSRGWLGNHEEVTDTHIHALHETPRDSLLFLQRALTPWDNRGTYGHRSLHFINSNSE